MIGDRIKELRARKGISQIELAKELDISNTTLSQYESSQRTPGDEIKLKIAAFFDVSLDYLLGRTDIKKPITEAELPNTFKSPESAIKFILEQNVIMGYGGFDINRLSNEEIMEFADELLHQLRLLSYKYKK